MGKRKEYDLNNLRLPDFTGRFRKKVDAIGGITKVSEITGISRPTINFWYNGQRTPDAESLKTLSEKLDVSADWLLGLVPEDNSTNDEKLRMISEYTGLSNTAIQNLHNFLCSSYRYGCKKWCNYMITSEKFMALTIGLSNYAVAFAKTTVEDWKREKEDKKAAEQGKAVIRFETGKPSFDEEKDAAGWRLSKVLHEMTTDIESTFGIDDIDFLTASSSLINDEVEYAEFIEYMKTKAKKVGGIVNGKH